MTLHIQISSMARCRRAVAVLCSRPLLTAAGCKTQAHRDMAASLRTSLAASVAQPGYRTQTRYDQAQGLSNQLYERVDGEFAGACTGA